MHLTRHQIHHSTRWALDGQFLAPGFHLGLLLELPAAHIPGFLENILTPEAASGALLPPLEAFHEVWASGVTYIRSRDARVAESHTANIYEKVYLASRPELFFKALGTRCAGHGQPVRVRKDSPWNVPEPELVLVTNRSGEIVGYTAGNDMSSRSIEAENPLYLPQAKMYNGSTALGAGIELCAAQELRDLSIKMQILRAGQTVFEGETRTSHMKRSFPDLVSCLYTELDFPQGAFLFTGTGIVPPDDFTLHAGDALRIWVGRVELENRLSE